MVCHMFFSCVRRRVRDVRDHLSSFVWARGVQPREEVWQLLTDRRVEQLTTMDVTSTWSVQYYLQDFSDFLSSFNVKDSSPCFLISRLAWQVQIQIE